MNTLCILRLRSISLQNFRSFKDTVKISDLKRVNVLVGPNKAGKSNVFEALSLLKSLANDDANSRRNLDDYRFDHAKQNKIVIEIEIELSPSEQLQVVELLGRSNLFDNLDFENSKLFKHLKYHLEIGDISELGRCSLNITKEEFFVSDNDDNYILLIYHKIANGSANQYYVDLKEASQIDLGNMSYGLQQILILLLAIMETEINETVCIEEPEIHLHATSQKRSLT